MKFCHPILRWHGTWRRLFVLTTVSMCCVCVPSSVLKVQLIYSEPFFQPSSLFLPVVSTNRCFGKSRFSLLAYLSVYPLIYILQYIVYTLHTVYIQPPVYTRTHLLCQPMRKICKKSQYALTRWSWVQFTSVCTMQWGSCRQAVLDISRQSVRQACMAVCTAKTVRHAPPPPCRKCITNSIRNCHLQIKR